MKKLFVVLFVLVMSLCLTVCFAEETEEKAAGTVAMPNPVVEYGSLEEINAIVGVELMHPGVMGVTNERFSVIGGTVAQYACEINGREWTFRAAYVTDADISGMYYEYNEFTPGEDFTLYTNAFYLERFFDGDRQYTIVAEEPVSADGDVYLDEETFMDICMEFESIQKQHMDDPLVGDYQNPADERMILYVERQGDRYALSVNLNVSDREFKCWTMTDAEKDGDRITYKGEEIGEYTYDEEGNETSSNVTAANNIGYFEIRDGRLYWTGAAEEECRTAVFEKIVYSDEPADETEIAEGSETALPRMTSKYPRTVCPQRTDCTDRTGNRRYFRRHDRESS